MKALNFEDLNLQSMSLYEMTEVNGGETPAYEAGYQAGLGVKKALTLIGVYLLFI